MSYASELITNKKFRGNIVIKIGVDYFAVRQPDSGLVLASPYDQCVASLVLNPTQIDIRKVTTTISTFSFRLLDKNGIISALVGGDAKDLVGEEVKIYLGRSFVNMDFSEYFELPVTYLKKCDHGDNSYNFSSSEQTERMAKPIYDYTAGLGADILVGTTEWTMRDDISGWPSAGFLKVDDEFVSYAGIDLLNNRFTGVIRGELNSIPAEHEINSDVVLAEGVTDHPLNILLKILISDGGGGTYDVLQSGLGISENLIDVAGIEALRDDIFAGEQFDLVLFSIPSALRLLEDEILMPRNLRFTNSADSKLTVAVLDKAIFVEEDDVISEDTMTKFPKWAIDGDKVSNVIEVQWDYNEGTDKFQKRTVFQDADSITKYGKQLPLKFNFKGIKEDLDGNDIVNDFGDRLLARLSSPTPEVSLTTQIDKSLQNIGGKSFVISNKIPASDGSTNFASILEVVSRAINVTNGDVQFKLLFTSFTNIRSAFIAPSDKILSSVSQKKVNILLGRGAQYKVGWYMRLWDDVNQVYMLDPPNKIVEIIAEPIVYLISEDGDYLTDEDGNRLIAEQSSTEDTIVFEDDWTTPMNPEQYRIRFADYNEATASQHRYGFISDDGNNFDDGTPTYRITF